MKRIKEELGLVLDFKMKTKLLTITGIMVLIAIISFVQSASVITFLFYDATNSDTLQIMQGEIVGITVSANGVFENITLTLDLVDSFGNSVNLLDVYVTEDEYGFTDYSNHLTITPAMYSAPGEYTIVSTVTGTSGETDTATLYLEVRAFTPSNSAPEIISIPPVSEINENEIFNYQIIAIDADNDPLTYSLSQNPGWLTINSSGFISGIAPNVESDYEFIATVEVSDGKDFDRQVFTILVKDTNEQGDTTAPLITVISPENNQIFNTPNVLFEITINEAVDTAWMILNGMNLSLNPINNRHFNLVSSLSDGDYEVVFYATDSAGNTGESNIISFSIDTSVVIVNNPPVIISSPLTTVDENTNYNYLVLATDADGDSLTYSLTQAPNWLTINSITGLISGTAPEVDVNTPFAITIRVSDGKDFTEQSYTLAVIDTTIISDTTAPIIIINSPENGATYTSHRTSITYTATDNVGLDFCWYSLDNGITNISVVCNQEITGITSVEGINIWTIYAQDTSGNIGSASITFNVNTSSNNGTIENRAKSGGVGLKKLSGTEFEEEQYLNQFETKKVFAEESETEQKNTSMFQILLVIFWIIIFTLLIALAVLIIQRLRG